MPKIKLELEGWHCLSKKDMKSILTEARFRFDNANFVDNSGLLIDTDNEISISSFCLEILDKYKKQLGSWDGYCIRKISKRIIFNYQDKKRKLSFEYFKKLVTENKFDDFKVVLAGILYLESNELKTILGSIERQIGKLYNEMCEEELKKSYNLLIKDASSSIRKFSVDAQRD